MDVREKLVELLFNVPGYVIGTEGLADHLIANGVTLQEWIPVTEQKPEENKNVKIYTAGNLELISVLVCGGNRGVTIANRVNVKPVGVPYLDEHITDGWQWSVGNEDVTHWMPLPQPPKGE